MKKIIKTTIKSVLYVLYYGIIALLLYFVVAGRTLTDWYDVTFGTRFREIVYTFNLGLTGADTSFMNEALQECRPDLIKATAIVVLFILADLVLFRRVGRRKVRVDEAKGQHDAQKETAKHETVESKPEYRWVRSKWGYALRGVYHVTILLICIFLAKPVYAYADQVLEVSDFVRSKLTYTKIYDEKYVAPSSVQIQNTRKQKRNVIIIYMESMETTYASKNLGGYQDHNLMPNLYNLQQENIAFGDRKGMAGTHNPSGTTWTTASILSSSSGIPFAFNMGMNKNEGNDADQGKFAKGITTLGDILEKQGYNQEFICGSDSTFGRKKKLFREHGSYKIFDYYSAIDAGYIDKDYKVWWGMEDFRTYEAAKDEILKLSEKDKPFNCTMLTVDTHHVGGYKCQKCPTGNGNKTANVVACADRQVQEFVDWCKAQDFYENTTIVILGDHPRMDKKLVQGVDKKDREAIDVFINSASPYQKINQKRTAATMDLFPTILSSMGYSIEGNRLGLGTNLFSSKKTLSEEMGYDEFNLELGKNSRFYHKEFE
ncbi:MAG: LTA synthase family protein [Clostridia bacterium]|nr:LTA synthase family protein [Clostridia bacterium]